jgi:hypothetical protein
MKPRYYPRAVVNASAIFTGSGFTGEGQVLDLTVPGCLIQSRFSAKKGESLTLRLAFPKIGITFLVARAVVRWVEGSRFGVEFVEMDQKERVRYNAAVDILLKHQAARHVQPDQKKKYSSQTGGMNWHLVTYGV